MGTSEILDLLPESTAESLGLFTMKNTREGMKRIIDNQMKLIKLTLTSSHNDDSDDNEKRVYYVEDIQKILGISKTTAYALIKEAPFRVVHIGNAIRISKADFDRWLDNPEQRRN